MPKTPASFQDYDVQAHLGCCTVMNRAIDESVQGCRAVGTKEERRGLDDGEGVRDEEEKKGKRGWMMRLDNNYHTRTKSVLSIKKSDGFLAEVTSVCSF